MVSCVSTTLPKTKISHIAPENGWLEDDPFLFGIPQRGRCELLYSCPSI